MGLEQIVSEVEVPRNTGIEGFIRLIRSILKLGRVQEIHISGNGHVTYTYLGDKLEPDVFNPEQLFEQVSPAYIIRNSTLRELNSRIEDNAAEQLFKMLRAARVDGLESLAWAVGADTVLYRWLVLRSGLTEDVNYPNDSLCGLPIYRDRMLPDESLTLCAGAVRGGELSDATHSYKIAMVLP